MKLILDAADVVCCTCVGCGDSLLSDSVFNYIVMDEATLTLEFVSMIPISLGATSMVLIGDPYQLSPSVSKNKPDNNPEQTRLISEIETTLFHRLMTKQHTKLYFLNIQHRMHPALSAFPSKEFYQSRLIDAPDVLMRIIPPFPWPDLTKPICFVNIQGGEKRIGTSICNTLQANAVAVIVTHLIIKSKISAASICVLTFYKAQVKELQQALIGKNIEVFTIDSFQGKEKDFIIFSMVRSNTGINRSLNFCDHPQRINVLLTRAKCGIIGIGDKDAMTSDVWQRWLSHVPMLTLDSLKSNNDTATLNTQRKTSKDSKFV